MELSDALQTTGAVRNFTSQPVDDALVYEILDVARFAPSGGNRQGWRVIVINDPETRRAIGEVYLDAWHDYVGHLLAGVVPFSPLASDDDRRRAQLQREAAIATSTPDGFAETISDVPVMLVVGADIAALAATDLDLDRYHFVGGASIYPFVWSVLLAARERGLGGVMTTVATRNEPMMKEILHLPESVAVAAVVILGHPERQTTRLKRRSVEAFSTIDTLDGKPFTAR